MKTKFRELTILAFWACAYVAFACLFSHLATLFYGLFMSNTAESLFGLVAALVMTIYITAVAFKWPNV